jgi:hypothetical protein
MIVAQDKRKNDVAGYMLYMWQIEDLIRAARLDMGVIESTLISKYQQSGEVREALYKWYDNLVEMMKLEKKEKKGHLQVLVNTLNEMNHLHLQLMQNHGEVGYQHLFMKAAPLIKELGQKMQPVPENDIELMLAALYNAFALRLKGEALSTETNDALKLFGQSLSMLSAKYKAEQEGALQTD